MRVVICWTDLTGYMASCWRALAARPGIDLHVLLYAPRAEANQSFGESLLAGLNYRLLTPQERAAPRAVAAIVAAHQPDVIVVPGWFDPSYRSLVAMPEFHRARFVMTMDNPWKHTWRQRLARLRVGRYVDRMAAVLVAGERAWQFARRLEVPEHKIFRGALGFDLPPIENVYDQRRAAGPWPRRFLFMGRYVDLKGFDFLLPAYRAYRARVSDPWPFTFCGQGPLAARIAAEPGAEDWGFCQPTDQPRVLAQHGVFVMPSWYEAWGVAVAEAMAAGLPTICTEEVGAVVELVRSYYTGLMVPTRDAAALTDALVWMHENHDRLPDMGRNARVFAAAHSAALWAERFDRMCHKITR
jgi:glycosyltransferase involved in cell wall biosynthesis